MLRVHYIRRVGWICRIVARLFIVCLPFLASTCGGRNLHSLLSHPNRTKRAATVPSLYTPIASRGEIQGTSHHRTSVLPAWGGVVARRQRRKRARSHSQCLRPNWTTHPNGNSRVMEPSARLLSVACIAVLEEGGPAFTTPVACGSAAGHSGTPSLRCCRDVTIPTQQ